MSNKLDRQWWAEYRRKREARLDQEEIVVRATQIERLWQGTPSSAKGTSVNFKC